MQIQKINGLGIQTRGLIRRGGLLFDLLKNQSFLSRYLVNMVGRRQNIYKKHENFNGNVKNEIKFSAFGLFNADLETLTSIVNAA